MNDELNFNATMIGEIHLFFALSTTLILFLLGKKHNKPISGVLGINFILNLIPVIGLIAFFVFAARIKIQPKILDKVLPEN